MPFHIISLVPKKRGIDDDLQNKQQQQKVMLCTCQQIAFDTYTFYYLCSDHVDYDDDGNDDDDHDDKNCSNNKIWNCL